MTTTIEGKLIRTDQIDCDYERAPSLVEDDALRKSIETQGVQQPLVLVSKPDGRYSLIDGFRRLEIARFLDLKSVPAVVDQLPEGADPKEYMNRWRLILDEHRQDLFPTQRAALIRKMQKMFGMTQAQVATYLGIDPGSASNWLAIEKYIAPVQKAIDSGEITLFAGRALDGFTEKGQERVWRSHRKDLASLPGAKVHKLIRQKYPPTQYQDLYVNPENTLEKLKRQKVGRRSKRRPRLTRDEKQVLANSLELQETELEDLKTEMAQMKREIALSTQPIRGILRDKELVGMLSEEVKEEFDRFSEVYI